MEVFTQVASVVRDVLRIASDDPRGHVFDVVNRIAFDVVMQSVPDVILDVCVFVSDRPQVFDFRGA